MTNIAKKVKDTLGDVKDKAVGTSEHTGDKAEDYVKQTESDTTREYEANEPMSPAKIKEHEPTAVRRQDNTSSSLSSTQDPKERLRRSGMTEGTGGSTETGDEYEQGGSRDK